MKNKGIVIAMVVILAAVAVGAFLITNAKDKESPDNMNMTKQQMSASSAAKEKALRPALVPLRPRLQPP